MQGTPEAPTSAEEPGAVARLVGVFFSPARIFESIARKPGWVVPFAALAVCGLVGGLLIAPRLDVDALVQKQIAAAEKQGRTVTAEQMEPMRKGMEFFIKKLSPLIGPVYWAVLVFMVPGIYHGLSVFLGKSGKYMAVVSAYAHVQMVQLVKAVLTVAVALPRERIDPEEMGRLLKSNVGAFLDPEGTPAGVRALLANVDVFDLWGLALCILALTRVTRLGQGPAAGVVLGVWAVWVAGSAALAALGAAVGG